MAINCVLSGWAPPDLMDPLSIIADELKQRDRERWLACLYAAAPARPGLTLEVIEELLAAHREAHRVYEAVLVSAIGGAVRRIV